MVKVINLIVGELQTNCYLFHHQKSNNCLIIDPGDDADYITTKISNLGLIPKGIILTHGHYDHVLAAGELRAIYDIPLLANPKDIFLIKRARVLLPIKIDCSLTEAAPVKLDNLRLKVIETPGHTPGSICLYSKTEMLIFCGDLIFAESGVGRSDFSYCNSQHLKQSINKILKLPGKTKVYPGHGNPFVLKGFKY